MERNKNKNNFDKIVSITIYFLIFSSFLSILRMVISTNTQHSFINWNILLSAISLFAALFFYRKLKETKKNITTLFLIFFSFIISFIFLPNSPYLITDSSHLSSNLTYKWYDSVMFFSAALAGILVYSNIIWIYFLKLRNIFSEKISYFMILLISPINAFGIYLGRTYEILDKKGDRFNSWDLFSRPTVLLDKITDIIKHPFSYKEFPLLFLSFSLLLIFISIITIYLGRNFIDKNK